MSTQDKGIAMMGGHVAVDVATVSNAARHIKDKQLRILGITAPHRLGGIMADVPTWKRQGLMRNLPAGAASSVRKA